jgi:signal transduction histidine kinase
LFEIDLVISRTLVFGAVAAFITGIYALLVVGVGQWIGVGSSNVVLSVASTAIVALLFEPFRVRAQRLANRLVYGTRATPYEVLSDLTVRLSEAESLEGLLDRMARRLADGTGAQSAVVWALDGDDYLPVAGWPERPTEPKSSLDRIPGETVAVAHDGDPMGALSVVKPRGELLTSTEIALLDDLAGSAGLVMGKLRLDSALEVRAHELADSRRRLVTAQDVERRRLERDLHDGAQQLVVSLKVKLGIASQVARSEDGGEVADLLDNLAGDAQLAIDEIRSLARGIFPPLLESEGLKSAVGSLAASSGTDVTLDVEDPGTLPRDVESAVYFCISEALTNAGKHAPGSPVEISVARDDQRLSFSVADRGPGMAASNGAAGGGSGLRNMRDRVEALGGTIAIEERQGGGVEVRGELTVEPDLATV